MSNSRLVRFGTLVAPHGLVRLLSKGRVRAVHEERAERYRRAVARVEVWSGRNRDRYAYEDAIASLVALGLSERHVREGSIPEASIEFIVEHLAEVTPSVRASLGLHIGNYLGVSLVAITAAEVNRHPESLVVGIDPNLPHRGTAHTQDHVCRLVDRFGLDRNVMLVCGYSGTTAPSNQGWVVDGYDPAENVEHEAAPSEVLANLSKLSRNAFDWALADGNHDAHYLRDELAALTRLVRPGGAIFLDDCSDAWPEIRSVFEDHRGGDGEWAATATDGRIGVLRRRNEA